MRGVENVEPGGRLPIILAHGRAFGSGEHETTSSCLEELETVPVCPGTRALDLGSGTGVLSVAAARLGAGSVLALDPSRDAAEATLATARLNGLVGIIRVAQAEIEAVRGAQFDLIMANLFGDILLRIGEDIASMLAPGGYLLLSGILYADKYDVELKFTRAGCRFLKSRCLEDYVTMVFGKPS
jgi:ribosomal protein L11 methyltransferase